MAEIMYGKPVADGIYKELKQRILNLKDNNIDPTIAIIRVGDNAGSEAYEQSIIEKCEQIGIEVKQFNLPADVTQSAVKSTIAFINNCDLYFGCILMRPLPEQFDEQELCNMLAPEKDIDGISDRSLAGVFSGRKTGFAPCTAEAVMEMLDYYHVPLEGSNIAVVGRSLVIGKPVAMMLLRKNATVTICHTKTKNLQDICKNADIIIAAAGKAEIITEQYASEGQIIIDVGVNRDTDGKICGDVNFDQVEPAAGKITPVPGGIGSITTAILLRHTVEAARKWMLNYDSRFGDR